DPMPGGTTVAVVPHLALASDGRLVHEVAGPRLLVTRPATPGEGGAFLTTVLARAGMPSPDGGTYLFQPYLMPVPPPLASPAQPTVTVNNRLGADGDHLVAWMTST